MKRNRLSVGVAFLATCVSVWSAGSQEIADAPSLSAADYVTRPLRPAELRSNIAEVLRAYPDADVMLIGNNGTPFSVRGTFDKLPKSAAQLDANDLVSFLPTLARIFGLSVDNLVFLAKADDPNGMAHFAYGVRLNGLDVAGAGILVHVAKDGSILSAGATVPDETQIPGPRPSFGRSAADASLNARIGGRLRAAQNGRLVYFVPAQNQPLFLAWELPFSIDGGSDLPLYTGYVDALTGSVIEIRDQVQRVKNRSIRNLNGSLGLDEATYPYFFNGTIARTEGQAPVAAAAVNYAYDRSGQAYDYFSAVHQCNFGPNAQNATINVNANSWFRSWAGTGYTTYSFNALFYNGYYTGGTPYLYFGTGTSFTPNLSTNLANALDVVGHEYTHWLLEKRPLLPLGGGPNETGAINEGISDMFGAMVENYTYGFSSNVWLMGESTGLTIRSLADPVAYSALDYFPNYSSSIGIHSASGIASLAFKLACTGGTHPRPTGKPPLTVPSVGITDARQIFFKAAMFYLPPGSGFAALKAESYTAAIQNNFGLQTAAKVALAFDAVGVPYGAGNFRAVNISTRAWVGAPPENMVAGFFMNGGSTPKNMLIRAVGPTLGGSPYNVPGVLTDPLLVLNGVATNDNWWQASNASAIASAAATAGAFPLNANSNDAAILMTLNATTGYTADVSGVNGGTGVALMEVYDAAQANPLRLVNISTRAKVTPTQPVIAGFVVTGSTGKKMVIRAVGPELVEWLPGLQSTNPTLTLWLGGDVIYQNDNWGSAWNLSALTSAMSTVGAFALTSGSASSAMLVDLPPGLYTAMVSGTTGLVLVEVYEVP